MYDTSKHTRFVWPLRLVTICAIVAILSAGAPAARAGTTQTYVCVDIARQTSEFVRTCTWIDTGNARIRAGGWMRASHNTIHVQIDRINLGTPSGVAATTPGPKNSQSGYIPEYFTASVNEGCGPYHARMYFGIRWSDGTLWGGLSTPLTDWYSKCPNAQSMTDASIPPSIEAESP